MTRDEVMTRLSELLARCEFVAEVSAAQLEMQSPSADVDRSPRNHGDELLRKHLEHADRLCDTIERDLDRLQRSQAGELTEQQRDYYVLLEQGKYPEEVAERLGVPRAVVLQIRRRHGLDERKG